jgi:hypothetical protein
MVFSQNSRSQKINDKQRNSNNVPKETVGTIPRSKNLISFLFFSSVVQLQKLVSSQPNYNVKRLVARTTNVCNGAAGTHIFFGSATGPLELALGTVATRGGGV